ncbi:uncharacterized protein LOC130671237 [Microplitis mediator]|uniref:uncharacterized protein LOC130671237 n=1 Tax=Microplitis mediator TaxID=375433 RepID=UPI002556FD1B|nr:uncharacterized protein LOC130671237 [Microplitis mediator]
MLVNLVFFSSLMIVEVNCKVVKPSMNLKLGDVININYLNTKSNIIYDNIFENKIIPNLDSILSKKRELSIYGVKKFEEVILQYYGDYNIESIHPATKRKILKKYDKSLPFTFDIDNKYIKKYHRYELLKLCRDIEERKISLNMTKSINETLYSLNFDDIMNNTSPIDFDKFLIYDSPLVVVTPRSTMGTHFVSSITTGNCLYQIIVFKYPYHLRKKQKNSSKLNVPRVMIYTTPIKSMSHNVTLENLAMNYINDTEHIDNNETSDLIKVIDNKELCIKIVRELKNDVVTKIKFQRLPPKFKKLYLHLSKYNKTSLS